MRKKVKSSPVVTRKLRVLGNSIVVVIPVEFLTELGWKEGDMVNIILEDGMLRIEAAE